MLYCILYMCLPCIMWSAITGFRTLFNHPLFNRLYPSSVSRLAAMDQAIHRLNVGHYTLDVKVTQILERITRLDNKLSEMEDSLQQVSHFSKENRKEIGRLEGLSQS